MRFRIYKRKVLILTLVVAACGFVLWSSNGRQRKNDALAPPLLDSEPLRGAGHFAASVGIRRVSNDSAAPLVPAVPRPEVDNLTLRYRSLVYQLNFDQMLRNVDKDGTWSPGELVLVVQVHNRPEYLRLLIDSLRKAQGIREVLVIFSHDFWSAEINSLISSVDFCPVLQVFFPFSIQLYPSEFPGSDPRDCPRDLKKNAALK